MDRLSSYNDSYNRPNGFESIPYSTHSVRRYSYWKKTPESIRWIYINKWDSIISGYKDTFAARMLMKGISSRRKILPKLSRYKRKVRYNTI